ncbi:efflux RND transporter periplasmic adaptor subunit, partial [Pseudomonas helleri]|uniref:efflux RND transporter periplasmic adaptor subunit n=1 Tax=Pseudomonas helleri TaxID=1608996 RepID=UPI003FD5ABFD
RACSSSPFPFALFPCWCFMSERSISTQRLLRAGLTLVVVVAAGFLVSALWRAYVVAPWTRDGRVSAQIVRIAPEVSGTVAEVSVADDQYVKRGEVLYRIDNASFALALAQAEAQLAAAEVSLRQKTEEARRRRGMESLVPAEDIQRANQAVAIAQAELRGARVTVDRAKLDLARTELRAPTDGYVTRLRLNKGDYAVAGQPNLALIDAHSFWITGYFEETKLRGIKPGAAAQIRLMGFDQVLPGRVASIGRGITDSNQQADAQGLPSVEPSFSWVRLAQRIPVRVEFDHVPHEVVLAAGMTGSIEVTPSAGTPMPQGRLISLLHRWM